MNIESLQIKRITGNWDTHKDIIPKDGEMVFIEEGVIPDGPRCIVIGDDIHTVESLVFDVSSRSFLSRQDVSIYINNLYPTSTSNKDRPGNINAYSNLGDSWHFARANHSHQISSAAINNIVKSSSVLSDIGLRKIYAGTTEPSLNKGSVGDIYIKYEQ